MNQLTLNSRKRLTWILTSYTYHMSELLPTHLPQKKVFCVLFVGYEHPWIPIFIHIVVYILKSFP